jgi:hypothetical protein
MGKVRQVQHFDIQKLTDFLKRLGYEGHFLPEERVWEQPRIQNISMTRLLYSWRILLLTENCEHAFGSAQFKTGLSDTDTNVKEACMILLGHWILKCRPVYLNIWCHLVLQTLGPPLIQNVSSEYNNPNVIFFTYPATKWSQKSILIIVAILGGHVEIRVLYIQECKVPNPSQQ